MNIDGVVEKSREHTPEQCKKGKLFFYLIKKFFLKYF
jgi:hypothetical protein